jgi:hypothetical protein
MNDAKYIGMDVHQATISVADSLSCFRIRKRRHENRMDLRRTNTPEPLNMTWAGERSEQSRSFQSPEMFFLLTLPFIERACIDCSAPSGWTAQVSRRKLIEETN